jgi:hypothetical protein
MARRRGEDRQAIDLPGWVNHIYAASFAPVWRHCVT